MVPLAPVPPATDVGSVGITTGMIVVAMEKSGITVGA